MVTKLIQLQDDILVEVEVAEGEAQEISGGIGKKVNSTFDNIQPILKTVSSSISSVWKEIDKDLNLEQAEIELGLSFEGEGNLFITKTKAGANIKIKFILKPQQKIR